MCFDKKGEECSYKLTNTFLFVYSLSVTVLYLRRFYFFLNYMKRVDT